MRTLVCLLAVIPMAHARIKPYTGEDLRSITLAFKSGTATFNLSKAGVTESIDFRVDNQRYSTVLTDCIPLHHIRFETAVFDVGEVPIKGSFTLTFQMGPEEFRSFGQLPQIQISFYNGRATQRLITRGIAENHSYATPLCPNDRSTY